MKKVYGIDFGYTYSALATLDDNGVPVVIENFEDSSRKLLNAVYFPENEEPIVGKDAQSYVDIDPERVVQYIKYEIGNNAWTLKFNGTDYDPTSIAALILKKLKESAEKQGYEVDDVVITCPPYFGADEHYALYQACKLAGLNCVGTLTEPSAAALYCCYNEPLENKKVLIYDLGGGSFDLTLLDIIKEEGKIRACIEDVTGDVRLGGIEWNNCLLDYMCELFEEETGMPLDVTDHELRQSIFNKTEDVKKRLTYKPFSRIHICYSGEAVAIKVSAEEFEQRTEHLVQQTIYYLNDLLNNVGISSKEIDAVLLVGGATYMPMIKRRLEEIFPGLIRRLDPELAVAKGAAIYAKLTAEF